MSSKRCSFMWNEVCEVYSPDAEEENSKDTSTNEE